MNTTWNAQNKCVMARVMRQGVRHQEDFPLSEYKTKEAAEKAAQAWLRKKIKELPPETPKKGRLTKANRSGVVGVWLVPVHFKRPSGKEYEYWRWTTNWPGCPNAGGVSWYVHQYGDEDAFVLAVLTRRLETANRNEVLAEFDRIDGKKAYSEILALKKKYEVEG